VCVLVVIIVVVDRTVLLPAFGVLNKQHVTLVLGSLHGVGNHLFIWTVERLSEEDKGREEVVRDFGLSS
jgi:hypothetical protein